MEESKEQKKQPAMSDTKIVPCAGLQFTPYVTLRECKKCKFHLAYRVEKEAKNGMPPFEVIACGVPRVLTVGYLARNVQDKGTAKMKRVIDGPPPKPKKKKIEKKEPKLGEV